MSDYIGLDIANLGQIDQIDHDLDHLGPSPAVMRGCPGSAYYRSTRKETWYYIVVDHADCMAPTRQHELDNTDHTDHTDHTDQEYIYPAWQI